MTTQKDLPRDNNSTIVSEKTAPRNSDQPRTHIFSSAVVNEERNQTSLALRSALLVQSTSCYCGFTSERGGDDSERLTGREDGWEQEEVQM